MSNSRLYQRGNRTVGLRAILPLALVLASLAGCRAVPSNGAPPVDPFTIVMLPDTQNYADANRMERGEDLREYFLAQTRWIAENAEAMDIAMVAHVGDIVQTDNPVEWEIADEAFRMLDGKAPYCLALGNHDMRWAPAGSRVSSLHRENLRQTCFVDYFPPTRFEKYAWYGGNHGEDHENYFCLFERGNEKFIVLALEYYPRKAALHWARGVLKRHSDHQAIVVTHAYLDPAAELAIEGGGSLDGTAPLDVWRELISESPNVFLVLSGHYLGEAYRAHETRKGRIVHEMLADYQGLENGGNAYLRLLTFHPDAGRVDVETYSPALDKHMTGESSRFSFNYREESAADVLAETGS